VVGTKSPSDVNHERERRVLRSARRRAITAASGLNAQEASSASVADPQDYGSITQLRELLGLAPSQNTHDTVTLPEDALIVSIDTEWEHRRLRDFVVEVGITILDTRDIINVAPGKFGDDWFSKTKTYHYVASATKRRKERIGGCFFSKDVFGTYATIRRDIVSVLQRAAHPLSDDRPVGHGPRKVVLVGHSVVADLQQLYRSPSLALDLLSTDVFLTKPTTVFDTFMLTVAAKQQGANIRQRRLGWLVNWLGVHPRYRRYNAVIGCHNAGNDAAYTMMALLMYAIRWDQIVPGKIVPLLDEEIKQQRELSSRPYGSTLSFEELRSRLEDSTLEENISIISEQLVEPITLPSSTPSASAEAEPEHVEREPLSSSSPSTSAKAEQKRINRKKLPLSTPSTSVKPEISSQPVSTGNTFWGFSLQKLTGWWRQP
jgi:hypothetical protein